jgi:hypothetical protein
MSEDPGEDVASMERHRQACENMTGWNGSLTLFRAERREGTACPEHIRRRLAQAREVAMEHYRRQKARGLCL